MWSGESSSEIQAPIDAIWAFLGDFYSVSSWMPLMSCTDESGRYETEVGCRRTLRRVSGEEEDDDLMAGLETADHDFNMLMCEQLLSYDPHNYTYSYCIEENNLGLNNYFAEVQLWEGSCPGTTYIRWTFQHDPIDCHYTHKQERIAIIENIISASIQMLETAVHNSLKH